MKKPEKPPLLFQDLNHDDKMKVVEVMQDPKAFKEIEEITKSYPYWEKFKYLAKSIDYPNKILWAVSKLLRKTTKIPFGNFEFQYAISDKMMGQLHHFDLNMGGSLNAHDLIPDHDKERYLLSSLMEEAIASSQLEGAATTRIVAKEMLRSERAPRNHSEKMILNNYLTMKEIVRSKHLKLTPDLILKIHQITVKDTLNHSEYEGKFRLNDNIKVVDHITGEIFYDPPRFKDIQNLIHSLCEFANSEHRDPFIHPIVKGIILHFSIGFIHPFVDGNGRTARAIFYWYLLNKNYWIVEYLSLSRIILRAPSKYAKSYLYTEYDSNDLTYFIEYNLDCMGKSLEDLKLYIAKKISEKRQVYQLIKTQPDLNPRQAAIVREALIDPNKVFTIKEVQNTFSTVYQTARADLIDLVSKGYFQNQQTGKKFLFYPTKDLPSKLDNEGNPIQGL